MSAAPRATLRLLLTLLLTLLVSRTAGAGADRRCLYRDLKVKGQVVAVRPNGTVFLSHFKVKPRPSRLNTACAPPAAGEPPALVIMATRDEVSRLKVGDKVKGQCSFWQGQHRHLTAEGPFKVAESDDDDD